MKKSILTKHITPIYSIEKLAILYLITKFIMTDEITPLCHISAFTYTQSIMLSYLYP